MRVATPVRPQVKRGPAHSACAAVAGARGARCVLISGRVEALRGAVLAAVAALGLKFDTVLLRPTAAGVRNCACVVVLHNHVVLVCVCVRAAGWLWGQPFCACASVLL